MQWHFIYEGKAGRVMNPGGMVGGDFTGWHTFGAKWTPSTVSYYYDGRKVGEVTKGVTHKPMPLLLNLAVGSQYSGPVVTPSTMLVDYVRAWREQ
jgi:beta-glucanase (GH16 family)